MRALVPVLAGPAVVLLGITVVPDTQEHARIGDAVSEIEQLDTLRSSLAGAFGDRCVPADQRTFQQVCRPVGLRAREIAERNGWTVQQLAPKHRSPAHALDREAERVYDMMRTDPELSGIWVWASGEHAGAGRRALLPAHRGQGGVSGLPWSQGRSAGIPETALPRGPRLRLQDRGSTRRLLGFLPTGDRGDGRPE